MRLPALVITDEERTELEAQARSATVEARAAQRARIVLLAADGVSNREIGQRVGMHPNQVAVWRRRFGADRVAGLADEVRSGRPPADALNGKGVTPLPT